MSNKYPSVPAPRKDIDSMFRTVNALYQAYNAMVGVPKPTDLLVLNQNDLGTGGGNTDLSTGDPVAVSKHEESVGNHKDIDVDGATFVDTLLFNSGDPDNSFWKASSAGVVKALEVVALGNDAADPSVNNSFNLESIVHTGTGRYQVTLATKQLYGVNMLGNVVTAITVTNGEQNGTASETIAKWASFLPDTANAGAGTFEFEVFEIVVSGQGTNTALSKFNTDLAAPAGGYPGDVVSIMLHITGETNSAVAR